MEDVQFADPIPARGDEPMTSVEEQPSTSELPVTVDPAVRQTEGGPFVDAIPPKNIVEVVIEKKAKVELEEPILPDHYYDGGNIPVFKPTMDQFRNFEKFITRINHYGMKAGIAKVIPPPEWRDALPALDDRIKNLRLKNAIEQQFAGSGGVFRQTNLEKRRIYSLPEWREVCESTDHQPPVRRGEVRTAGYTVGKRKPKPKKTSRKRAKRNSAPKTEISAAQTEPVIAARERKASLSSAQPEKACANCWTTISPTWRKGENGARLCNSCGLYYHKTGKSKPVVRPDIKPDCLRSPSPTIVSDPPSPEIVSVEHHFVPSFEGAIMDVSEVLSTPVEMDVDRQTPEPISRPTTPSPPPNLKRSRSPSLDQEPPSDREDEYDDDWQYANFNYRISNQSEYTPERCKELERIYWRTITFNNPMYGADLPGSLFGDETEVWNVAKLDNLLCRIGKTIPGVNSAYLYLGMWKATFSWHVEDMDLYSINYIHFGAPKQWYSISQCDAEKFESIMRSYFPNDHKGCPQFMRHKTFLVSPSTLENKGVKVNRLVHHEGEFVITFPFGYHSGYNLGYNCAESVNFATDYWLEIGRNARKCNCVDDSVNVNVDDIIDAVRGVQHERGPMPLTPPDSNDEGELKKKQRNERKKAEKPEKILTPRKEQPPKPKAPCILCPNDPPREVLLPTTSGKHAHRICAEYIPETYIQVSEDGQEIVAGGELITHARWNLKCLYCSSTKGAKFQCSVKSCVRAYHPTCALAAGVLVETVVDEQGYASSYQCRFHRPRRYNLQYLEDDKRIAEYANKLQPGDSIQARFAGGETDTPFVGVVMENCQSEQLVIIELATGNLFEVDYKWILAPPIRDVRALCATQSTPGSTKQRQKKKKPEPGEATKEIPPTGTPQPHTSQPETPAVGSQPIQPVAIPAPSNPLASYAPIPLPLPVQNNSSWTAHNPGLAQYHQFVWQIENTNPNSVNSENASATIMEKLGAQPRPRSAPKPTIPTISVPQMSPIILPPAKFNMGSPPPSLLAPRPIDQHIVDHPEDHQNRRTPNPQPYLSIPPSTPSPALAPKVDSFSAQPTFRPLVPRPPIPSTAQQVAPSIPLAAPPSGPVNFTETS